MGRPFVTFTAMAALLGNDRDQLIRAARQFEMETWHVRTSYARGKLTLAIGPADAKIILARFSYLVDNLEVDPASLLASVPAATPRQPTAAPTPTEAPKPPPKPLRPVCAHCGGMIRVSREYTATEGTVEMSACMTCGKSPDTRPATATDRPYHSKEAAMTAVGITPEERAAMAAD